ncbi:ABC transporter permease [Thermosediminibacter oceani]|uniref:ABC-2 type transporter n=1 Tax=Thermosediminibacter oceani (strain ATCC BAA-1034 / DSM 16646 / JW/IW-1228P) TaxID=555079 RepID=D9RYQ0_THEOJ|nr:ABC-2 family transporter protein [Thermosediminibacter oceani]ADL08474.1 protein of unknown function DUF990 [Thermosediminibacter oceani DSM 16646]
MLKSMDKYIAASALSAKNYLAYTSEVIFRSGFLVVILFVFVNLWTVTYSRSGAGVIAGLDLKQMLWYLVFTESIVISRPRVDQKVEEDIRTGTVSYTLARPYNYLLFQLSVSFGERTVRFICTLLVGYAVMTIMIGPYIPGLSTLPFLIVTVALAMLADLIGMIIVGFLAFWVEDVSPFFLVYSRLQMLLGGMIIPITLFPPFLRKLSEWLPFRFMVYAPAKLFVDYDINQALIIMAEQTFLCILLFLIGMSVYRMGVKRLDVNGG